MGCNCLSWGLVLPHTRIPPGFAVYLFGPRVFQILFANSICYRESADEASGRAMNQVVFVYDSVEKEMDDGHE